MLRYACPKARVQRAPAPLKELVMRGRLLILLALLAGAGCQDSDSDADFARNSGSSGTGDLPAPGSSVNTSGAGGGGSAEESDDGEAAPVLSGPASTTPSGGGPGGVGGGSPGGFAGGGVVGGFAGGVAGGSVGGASVGASAPIDTSSFGGGVMATTGGTTGGSTMSNVQQAGQLTAGAWDDNLNFERFSEFRKKFYDKQTPGLLPFSAADFAAAHAQFEDGPSAHTQLDIALVIDTTGSMGDEIGYLQREFISLSSAIEAAYPQAEQRWALVVYRDQGDEYLTRQFDFAEDLETFRQRLAQQGANGGGDFPEAPEAAFEVMNQFSWRSAETVSRLAFWVADAPHHTGQAGTLAQGIRTAQEQGIHVYPVASSGIDEFTELGMRSAAQLTGGRYLFLTNDSGIGGDHKEPSIPCYFVTLLRDAILRMVDIEMSGEYHEPAAAEVIRRGGNPQDGACELESGNTVYVY
jgi:hypothetical protein